MAKTAPINPFMAAKAKPAAASKPKVEVQLAGDVIEADGKVKYTREQVVAALENYCLGHDQADEAEALMNTAKPIVTAMGLQVYAQQWIALQRKPDSPKVTTDPNATRLLTYTFQDRQINLNEGEYAILCNLLGADVAEANVENRNEFKLKPETLDTSIHIKDSKGKTHEKTVMEFVAEALQEKFVDHPDILANLFEMKPIFRTQKSVLHKALQLTMTAQGIADKTLSHRIQAFVKAIKTPISLKPSGGTGE